jgi:ATP-dependent DNA helicase RecQ
MSKTEFVKKYFAGEKDMLDRATSAESYQKIVDQLNNAVQIAVVSARSNINMLVLAGPGSGKTRIIAHRCAYLLRVERVRPREILVVCFNRSAAISLRQRIRDLIGKNAARVTVQTYHGLAMRLIGASFTDRLDGKGEMPDLNAIIPEATKMLRGEVDIPGLEPDEMRERLLAGYRHILIDEYQDIDQPQYDMVSAIAGRALESENEDAKLSILAVGDDDQNVYTFRGANIQFIRQFETDYNARTHYLIENYRSTANIINVSNQLIALNRDRMKTDHPIQINAARRSDPPGQPVQIVRCHDALHQARFVYNTIRELKPKGGSIAVFARTKKELHSIRAALEYGKTPSIMAADSKNGAPLHRMREPLALISLVKELKQNTTTASRLQNEFQALECYDESNPWCQLVDDILKEWKDQTNNNDRSPAEVIDFIYEALHERQRERDTNGRIYLSTVQSAKGLEFDHVIVLGKWGPPASKADQEEERRIYYVGMTRARKTLALCELEDSYNPHTKVLDAKGLVRLKAGPLSEPPEQSVRLNYALLDLSSVWISYPVAAKNAQYARQEIAALKPGARVGFEEAGARIYITNKKGHKIGALSNAASKEWADRLQSIKEVRVHSIVNWRKDLLDEKYVKEGYPEDWEVPLLEVISFDGSQNG